MLCTFEKYLEHNDMRNIMCNDDEASELITDKNELITDVADEVIVAYSVDFQNKIVKLVLKEVNFCKNCENCLKNNSFLFFIKITNVTNKLLKTRAHRRNVLKVVLDFLKN